jgi:hypothetical protein
VKARAAIVALYAVAMGHLEAVVVYYIRYALGDVHGTGSVSAAVLLAFPWNIEQTREAATIVMLVAVAVLAGRDLWERVAAFLWAFAIWDAMYYLSLKLLTQWPPSLGTPDIYFLLPLPWAGPVWIPLLADLLMVAVAGVLVSEARRRWSAWRRV